MGPKGRAAVKRAELGVILFWGSQTPLSSFMHVAYYKFTPLGGTKMKEGREWGEKGRRSL